MPDALPPPTRAGPDPVPGAGPAAPSPGRRLRSLAVDVAPLRDSRDFRLLFFGQGVSSAGTMITFVAVPFQAYALSRSSLVVGLVSLTELVPILLMAVVGGALADAVDRRRMVRLSEAGLCVCTAALLVNAALPHPRLWVLFIAVACAAAMDALQRPSLDALVPRLVRREHLAAAAALESLLGTAGQVAGPAIAGVLIATAGLPATLGVDLATFAVSLTTLSLMRAAPPPPQARVSLAVVAEGFRYAWRRQDLLGSYLVDMNAMFFGMPIALFPQMASGLGGPAVLGLLYMAPSAGAFIASATSGWAAHVRRHGRAIALAAGCWGIAITGLGFAPTLPLALLALAVAGGADMVSGIFRSTLWNQTIPDSMRGRLAGIEMISYSSGPALGNLESGVVGALAGIRASIVSGGILCIAGTIALSASLRRFWQYQAAPPAHRE